MTEATVLITTGVGGDTQLGKGNPTYNYGARVNIGANISVNKIVSLLRFDLSSIPAGSTCTSAKMVLRHTTDLANEITFSLYKVTDANGDWVEGVSLGLAKAGEPCWNAKAADGSGGVTTAWAGSAGLQTAGTDYVNTVIASVTQPDTINANEAAELIFNASGLAVLEDWFGDATNNGFLLVSNSADVEAFHSKEASTAGYRPSLVVNYEVASTSDDLTAADFTLAVVTFDAPTLGDALPVDVLTAVDLTLSPVTFDAPTLTSAVLTPDERTYVIDAENREYTIQAESREYTVDADMRGLKIDKGSETKYAVGNIYDALTGLDLTLARPMFDAPSAGLFGYYNIDDGLSAWYTARDEETYPMVWITGDSIVHGDHVDAGTGWAQMLEAAIHTAYGTGGHFYTVADGATYWTTVGEGWTANGGSTLMGNQGAVGLIQGYYHNADNTNTLVLTATGKIFEVIYFVRTGLSKAFTIQLDSETPENADVTGTFTIKKHTITAAAAGEHTITITPASSGGDALMKVVLSGITVKNGTGGAIVYNSSYGGKTLGQASGQSGDTARAFGIPVWGAHLHIIAIGINDYKTNPQASLANFALWLTKMRENKAATESVLYLTQTPYDASLTLLQSQYNALYQADAALIDGAMVDVHTLMGTTPAAAYASGYFDALNDVHPNETGHMAIYNAVQPFITA